MPKSGRNRWASSPSSSTPSSPSTFPIRHQEHKNTMTEFTRRGRHGNVQVTIGNCELSCSWPVGSGGEVCGKSVGTPWKMREHLVKAHAEGLVQQPFVCSECRLCARQKKGLSQCRCRKVTEGAAGSNQIPASAPQNPAQSAITDQELEVLNGVVKNLYPLNNQQLLDVAVEAIQRANQQLGHIRRRMRQTSGGPRETPHSSHSPDPQLNFNGGGTPVQPIAPVTPSPPPATSPNSGNPQNKRSFQDFNVDPSLSGYHHSPLTWSPYNIPTVGDEEIDDEDPDEEEISWH